VLLLFVGTSLVLLGAGAVLIWSLVRKQSRRAWRIGEGIGVIILIYGGALLLHSLTSRDKFLEPGGLKYFCEVDCHLAYSVTEARTEARLGAGESAVTPRGVFYVVTVKTWFDPRTVSPHRGNSPLSPNPRRVRMEDELGRSYELSPEGMRAIADSGKGADPLKRSLRPGESYASDLVFDLPAGVDNPRLLISEDAPEARFIMGHEESFLHRKIWFRIQPASPRSPEEGNRAKGHPRQA
jgi:hypothetical protein